MPASTRRGVISMGSRPNKELYSQVLLATQQSFSAVYLSKLKNEHPSHDGITRWLSTVKQRPRILWEYTKGLIAKERGYLIIDDSVLDKWYAKMGKMALVRKVYSGLHHRVVHGIDVVNLLWNSEKKPADAQNIL